MPAIKLSKASCKWALKHLMIEGDTDFFPRPFEIDAIKFNWKDVEAQLTQRDINSHVWTAGRRIVVPKSVLGFRAATQLHPTDSLILAALVKTYGRKIEASRIPIADNRVFSYRFDPQSDGRLYGTQSAWHEFWQCGRLKAMANPDGYVAMADIADYYNQIYHHLLANQLREATVPDSVVNIIEKRFLSKMSHGVTRGIPVGPHSVHLLAECALNPIDRAMLAKGKDFCRYADDYHFFCDSEAAAEVAVFEFAETLDSQHRLQLQQSKTRIVSAKEYFKIATSMLDDQPANEMEEQLLAIIGTRTSGNPYVILSLEELSEEERNSLDNEFIEGLLSTYLELKPLPYSRIAWLFRRLSQLRLPGGIDFALQHLSELSPVLGDVSRYVMRAAENYEADLRDAGQSVATALKDPVVMQSEFVRMVLVNLLSGVPSLNHLDSVTANYAAYSPPIRRETVLAAVAANWSYWLKERKDEIATADPWLRRAILTGLPSLPGDEGEHWLKQLKSELSGLEKLVVRWTFKDKSLKVGEIKFFA